MIALTSTLCYMLFISDASQNSSWKWVVQVIDEFHICFSSRWQLKTTPTTMICFQWTTRFESLINTVTRGFSAPAPHQSFCTIYIHLSAYLQSSTLPYPRLNRSKREQTTVFTRCLVARDLPRFLSNGWSEMLWRTNLSTSEIKEERCVCWLFIIVNWTFPPPYRAEVSAAGRMKTKILADITSLIVDRHVRCR